LHIEHTYIQEYRIKIRSAEFLVFLRKRTHFRNWICSHLQMKDVVKCLHRWAIIKNYCESLDTHMNQLILYMSLRSSFVCGRIRRET